VVDPYIDPASGVLRNILGIVDQDILDLAEREATALRNVELKLSFVMGAYDLKHLQSFHRHLFQDVYQWAGEIRTVNISKRSSLFCLPEHIESAAHGVFKPLSAINNLPNDPIEVANILAQFLGDINALHPFREGNGRAQRCFIWQFAFQRGWSINWTLLDEEANTRASIHAMSGECATLAGLIEPLLEPAM